MIKLHKMTSAGHEYWEAWPAKDKIVVHRGIVGNMGQKSMIDVQSGEDPVDVIQRESAPLLGAGFARVVRDDMTGVVIHFSTTSWEPEEIVETRHYIEDLITQALGWTGNGHCDGGEIGLGVANVWCLVLDQRAAVSTISTELTTNRFSAGVVVAVYDEKSVAFIAVWPDSVAGTEVKV